MKTIQFIFGIHNHQPVGNFDNVFEEAYRKSYLPFIEVFENFPSITLAMHYSGCLLEWLEGNHPEFLDRVAKLVEQGNIEMLSAGFYEPILAIIPDHDKLGQISKLNNFIRHRFGYDPRGLWLTERVWEPHLAKPIKEAGIDYIAVDDFHFLSSGKQASELNGYFNTDEQGECIGVFPISQKMRYSMPFKEPEETIEILTRSATLKGNRVIVMADDGEKFGVWPGTYERCFGKQRWLERFFKCLVANQDWIKTTTFKDYFNTHPPKGRVYLPTVSYFEMSEWTLPAARGETFSDLVHECEESDTIDRYLPFLRGGTWRNFQSLYDESNWMHQRVTDTSHRLVQVAQTGKMNGGELQRVQDDLWRAQCNCAYWHGIFGGLYLPHLRHAIYWHLLSAESKLDRVGDDNHYPRDIDNDGAMEYFFRSKDIKIIIGQKGGTIKEFDICSKQFNLLDTMRRYQESYHRNVLNARPGKPVDGSIHNITAAKEPDLDKYLKIDPWPRHMLLDHFFATGTTLKQVSDNTSEQGNLPDNFYNVEVKDEITLTGKGTAFGQAVQIKKILNLNENVLDIEIILTNHGNKRLTGFYANELNFALLGGHTPDRYYKIDGQIPRKRCMDASAINRAIASVDIVNEWDQFEVSVNFKDSTDIWRFPVFTVSMSESGFEKIYQSSVVMPHWNINLKPGASKHFRFDIKVEEFGKGSD